MPTFENTIEALDRSGQMLNRVASAFFALLSAESNDEMMEISQRVQPMLSEHSNNISLNENEYCPCHYPPLHFYYCQRKTFRPHQIRLWPSWPARSHARAKNTPQRDLRVFRSKRSRIERWRPGTIQKIILGTKPTHTHIRTKCFERNQSFQHDALRERFGRTPPKRKKDLWSISPIPVTALSWNILLAEI